MNETSVPPSLAASESGSVRSSEPMPKVRLHGGYGTSRAVLNVIGAFGGLIAIGGGTGGWNLIPILFGQGSSPIPNFLVIPLFAVCVAALLIGVAILALAQIGLATVDSADYNKQMLELAAWKARQNAT